MECSTEFFFLILTFQAEKRTDKFNDSKNVKLAVCYIIVCIYNKKQA